MSKYYSYEDFIRLANEFINREYENNETLDETEQNIINNGNKLGVFYTESLDDLGLAEYNRQSFYDIETESLVTYVANEYVKVVEEESYSFNAISVELEDGASYEGFLYHNGDKIDLNELTSAIQLTAYTGDQKHIKTFARDNSLILEYVNFDLILQDKEQLLSRVNEETREYFKTKGVEFEEIAKYGESGVER